MTLDPRPSTLDPALVAKIRRIEITTNRHVNSMLGGEYHSVFKGRGIEFDEVRPYQEGDDIRTIDWKVTARTGGLHVKRYSEERELTVMLVVDVSGSGLFGTGNAFKVETAVELSALMAFSAIKNSDRVGLVLFSDEVEMVIPPKKGRNHTLRLIREILAHEAEGRGTDLAGALEFTMRLLTRRAIVFLISDFLAPDFERPLSVLNQRHDLIALQMLDPREMELPRMGLVPAEDAETGRRMIIDTLSPRVRRAFRLEQAAHQQRLEDLFRRHRVDHAAIRTDDDPIEPVIRLFRRRAARW
jgi:uncharacterized protein (DUF58 family)